MGLGPSTGVGVIGINAVGVGSHGPSQARRFMPAQAERSDVAAAPRPRVPRVRSTRRRECSDEINFSFHEAVTSVLQVPLGVLYALQSLHMVMVT